MSQIPHTSPFDGIRHEDVEDKEFWSARELYKLLGYTRWEKFQKSIEEAKKACENSNQAIPDHFHLEVKMIATGKGARRKTEDYHLSRYACYLIVQNADPAKPIVALGQTYFAYQTRRQEINDELALANLPEDQKRLIFRSLMSTYNVSVESRNVVPTPLSESLTKLYRSSCERTRAVAKRRAKMEALIDRWARLAAPPVHPSTLLS